MKKNNVDVGESEAEKIEKELGGGGTVKIRRNGETPKDVSMEDLMSDLKKKFPVKEDKRMHDGPDGEQSETPAATQTPVGGEPKPAQEAKAPETSIIITPVASSTPAAPVVVPPTTSLRERLLGIARNAETGSRVRQSLKEADEVSGTPEIARLFVSTISQGDEIGIRRLSFDQTPEAARENWYGLSWEEWTEKLQSFAEEGDPGAKEVLETVKLFSSNVLVRDLYRRIITEIYRPCQAVANYGQLQAFLNKLDEKKLVIAIDRPNLNHLSPSAVVIESGREIYLFLPQKGVQLSQLGWQFVKEAESRARKHHVEMQARIDILKKEAVAGLTPLDISSGTEGKILLLLGSNRGVLIEAKTLQGQMMARVVKTAGVRVEGGLPSAWAIWTKDYSPLRGPQWPSPEIPRGLRDWTDKIQKAREERQREEDQARKEFQKKIEPIMTVATLPLDPREKGLTRLLKGEVKGVIPLLHAGFEWGRKTALFGVAIERKEGEKEIRLVSFVSEFEISPKALEGEAIPLSVWEDEGGKVRASLEKLPQMTSERYQTLRMMGRLIVMRLNDEQKNQVTKKGEPAPAASV